MTKKFSVQHFLALIVLCSSFWYFVSPSLCQKYSDFVSSPVEGGDGVTLIVTNPTRLRELLIRVSLEADCEKGAFSIRGCYSNYRTMHGYLEVYASIYNDTFGKVDNKEVMEVGVYLYSESDALNRFMSTKCTNLKAVADDRREAVLSGTSHEGGGGQLYGLGDGYFSAVSTNGVNDASVVRSECPYEGALFSVNGEHVEALVPYVTYEFKNNADLEVRKRLASSTRANSGLPLNSLHSDCSALNDRSRSEYLSLSKEQELNFVLISSQICSFLPERYRIDRAYAQSVKDESFVFDRGLPYVNEVRAPVTSGEEVININGELTPVYASFRDDSYQNNETIALFWAALIGSPMISLIGRSVPMFSCAFLKCFQVARMTWRDKGHEFYEKIKSNGDDYGK